MIFDVKALELLTSAPQPPERLLRPSKQGSRARYYFGDVSGAGFSSSGWSPGNSFIEVEYGSWGKEVSRTTSSNFRELANIVNKIEELDKEGRLNDLHEVFIFTDNHHAESAFHRGTAESPEVLELMLHLHTILMKGQAFIHIVWISGKRMISQGIDGLSRSDLTSGVMQGVPMFQYVPLHLTSLERQPEKVKRFVEEITQGVAKRFITPAQWFRDAHNSDGMFIWTPPPCLGDVAVQLMAEAWQIRPWNKHVMVIPSLMAGRWRKLLFKTSDFLAVLSYAKELWPQETEYEPLTIAFVFPLLRRQPWKVSHKHRIIYANFGYGHEHWTLCLRAYHRQCYQVPLKIDPFPRGLTPRALEEDWDETLKEESRGWEVTQVEYKELQKEFTSARAGDHLMVPFVCELCHFRNVFSREPRGGFVEDQWVIACIVRANLDAFWARQPSTVYGNLQEISRLMQQSVEMQIDYPMRNFPRGPYPVLDMFGVVPAVMSLQQLLSKGRNSGTIQWDTMRGMRLAYSNFVHTTPGGLEGAVLSDG
ncbi:hypothetical protein ACA910_007917 [Epithemia clementina (nom. ined.)]